ncbi:hypothetical protein C0995_006200 [Termitomyces sp. Mi166|nr:hypothetical protein C0995_006200 [Termitomyces sp. Mi166\
MAPKILLLHVTADSRLLERECAAQEFIAAADAVFFKAQGLAMLEPLHKMAFGLLEGLLDNWCLLNLNSVKWPCKAEAPWSAEFVKMVVSWKHAINTIEEIKLMHFEKMMIELELTVPIVVPKTIVNLVPTPVSATSLIQHLHSELSLQEQEEVCAVSSALSLTQEPSQQSAPHNKGKGKAKVTEDDEDEEEATQKFRKELEDFMVPTTFFVLEGYKGKRKAKALLGDSEQAGAKQSFKSMELVDSDSDEEEEDRVCIIKKVKHEHIEEPTGARKRKEIIELDKEVEIVAPKTPVAGPLHQTSKP